MKLPFGNITSIEKKFKKYKGTNTVKRGNFDRQGNFDRLGSFVKLATVPIQECLFVASAHMEINN